MSENSTFILNKVQYTLILGRNVREQHFDPSREHRYNTLILRRKCQRAALRPLAVSVDTAFRSLAEVSESDTLILGRVHGSNTLI